MLKFKNSKEDQEHLENEIRINISKEANVRNHLNTNHENMNLLFYNFNS